MKNTSIKSINVAGTIGYVICILLVICTITGMVLTAIGTAAAISVSKEQVSVKVSTDVDVSATGNILEKLNHYMGVNGIKDLNDLITEEGKTISVNDSDLSEISVAKNENGLAIKAKMNDVVLSIKRIVVALISTFIMMAAFTVSVEMLLRLMSTLRKCETPFSQDVIKWMTRFAYSLIPSIVFYIITGAFWSSVKSGTGFSMTVDVTSILLVAIVCLLIVIFKYGAQLQQESDETL